MKKTIIFLILFILIVPIVMAKNYMEGVTIGQGDNRWCKRNGVCTFDTITTEAIITGNLSVIGQVFNVTMNLVTWNITDSFNVGGNLEAKNSTFENLNVTGTVDITHSLQDAYDDGSVIQVDDTDVVWDLSSNKNFTIQSTGTHLQLKYGSGYGDIYLDSSANLGLESRGGGVLNIGGAPNTDIYFTNNDYSKIITFAPTVDSLYPYPTDSFDLGSSTYKWRDGYFSRNLTNGSIGLSVANAKTAYDFTTNDTFVPYVGAIKNVDLGANNFTVDTDTFLIDSTGNRVLVGQTTGYDPRTGLSITGDLDVNHIATENDDHAMEIDVDAASFGDVKAIDIVYTTGAISAGEEEEVILINIDESAATGGDVIGIDILATEGSASIYGLEAGALVNPVVQLSGIFTDMDSANNSGVDNLSNFISSANDHPIFVNDDDYITIGDANKFEELEFLLNTSASNPGIKPTFEYSTGVDTWGTFSPADGTNGMRNTGIIAWFDDDIPTWATGAGTEYLIRINRTQNNLNIVPIEDKVQIAAVTIYKWDKNGDLVIRDVNATTICINNSCIDDWSDVNISGNGGGVTGLDSAYNEGENVIDVDTDDVVFNLTSTQDFIVQDNGREVFKVDDTGDVYIGQAAGDQILQTQQGSEAVPAYSFSGNTGTGMWSSSLSAFLQWSIAGSKYMQISTSQFLIGAISSTAGLAKLSDANTGIRWPTGDTLNIVSGAIEFVTFIESTPDITVFNEDSLDIDFRIETDTETHMFYIDSGEKLINISGGYGSTGVTIYDDGNISMAGHLVIDGTCLSEGEDCNTDIAELTHSKSSADNTSCNTISEHTEIITYNYYNITNEECEYQLIENFYYYICVNVTERYEFNNISEICSDNYELVEDNKYKKVINCVNESPTWTEEETITISRKTECSLNPNFNLEFESGDVVCIDKEDPQHIKFCDNAYDTSVLSVVNYDATLIINQRAPYPVSLSGNIPIKVMCNTPIEIGDLLVSSNVKGYAQSFKTWQPTATWSDMQKVWEHTGSPFAKALESCNSGNKTIRAWI